MRLRFSEHDKKLWTEMANLSERFLNRQISLKSLVTGLEGLLDAGEFGDKELRDRWYSFWLPLEIRNATGEVEWSADAARSKSRAPHQCRAGARLTSASARSPPGAPGAPLLAFEKWPAENRNHALWRQHRGPLLKKREKWRTPSWLIPTIKGKPALGSPL